MITRGEPVLRAVSVSKSYGPREVLKDVTFSIAAGRVVGLLGRNGAGKTTLMKVLLGFATPDDGSVELFGEVPGPESYARVGVAMDSIGFFPASTVKKEMEIIGSSLGVSPQRVSEVLDLVGLQGRDRQRCSKLSTGQRQRLRIAAALLVPSADLFILDEPANGLDPDGIRWMRKLLRSLAEAGKTVLVSSHQLGELENTVDDVLLLNEGRLVHSSTLADFTQEGAFSLEDRFFEIAGE
ncbi:ABC transporter ATP-binding protein [Streptomyces sp. NPDC056534]|uniref:ABC transporter ATP-binding protein n=1 Tax=Streptomyces sp. NPDC056534 TaxID=3345857 RepID=UPI0036B42CB8